MSRVLAIDDDPDILIIVEAALEIEGHSVTVSTDPRETLWLAIENDVDVIVLDVNMPEVSGFQALDVLREHPRTAGLPVLFLSALGESQHRIQGLRRGADDYLAKPFEPDELVLRVERLATRLHRAGATDGSAPELLEVALRDGFQSGHVFLGRYQALAEIGEGAMGVVLRGWDPRLKRPVALKTVRLDKLALVRSSRESLAVLIREASSLARFSHPNIVAVYDVGAVSDVAYIVMELVDGISLQELLAKGPLSTDQTIHLGLAVSRALAAAHAHRMVHRDVKPGNILLGHDGAIKVSDFGVADVVNSLAARHKIFGTPGFVPPECLLGARHTPAGDMFSLGAVLYKALAGKSAFAGASLRELLGNNLAGEAPPLHKARSGIPRRLRKLVAELLSRDPEVRPAAGEAKRRLAAMPAGEPGWDLDRAPEKRPVHAAGLDSGRWIDTGSLNLLKPPLEAEDEPSTPRG